MNWQLSVLGSERIAELLIENGANITLEDKNGKTALHYAAISGNS